MSSQTGFQLLNLQCQVPGDAPKFASVSFCWSRFFIANDLFIMSLEIVCSTAQLLQSLYFPARYTVKDHTTYRQPNPFCSNLTKESGTNCMYTAQVSKSKRLFFDGHIFSVILGTCFKWVKKLALYVLFIPIILYTKL